MTTLISSEDDEHKKVDSIMDVVDLVFAQQMHSLMVKLYYIY